MGGVFFGSIKKKKKSWARKWESKRRKSKRKIAKDKEDKEDRGPLGKGKGCKRKVTQQAEANYPKKTWRGKKSLAKTNHAD